MYVTQAVLSLVFLVAQIFVFSQLAVAGHKLKTDFDIVAFQQNSAPKYLMNRGNRQGVCGDIYARLQERLKNKGVELVVFDHLLPIRRILETLKVSGSGIFCGATRDNEREKIFTYSSQPIYSVLNILVTNSSNKYNPISLEDLQLSNASVGTYFGTGSAKYLKAMGITRVNGKFRSIELGLRSVAAHEIDYFFYHDLGLDYSLAQNSKALRRVPTFFRTYSHWMIYSKDMPEGLQEMVDEELIKLIDEGVVDNIRKKYQSSLN